MKRVIRLTENQLHNVIKESVKRIINEAKQNYWDFEDFELDEEPSEPEEEWNNSLFQTREDFENFLNKYEEQREKERQLQPKQIPQEKQKSTESNLDDQHQEVAKKYYGVDYGDLTGQQKADAFWLNR